ncbi:kinase-like protein [Tricholoma matsutake]|nr:kinase-like protein [Tricholoma matsutake 945]
MPTVMLAPGASSMILPSPASAKELTALERVNPGGSKPVSRFAPGILVKFGWDHDAEVRALQFVRGRLSVRTPGVLHHAPFPIDNAVIEPWNWRTKGVWYFFMEECQGVPLNTVIEGMSPTELDHIADQLLTILDEMHSYTSTMLASVTGGPYNNRTMPYPWHPTHAFSSVKEYLDYYRGIFVEFCGPEYVDELFSCFPTEAQVYLTHGDLLPHNILVDGSRITAIIDWETAGYYPEFWEYCRMHDPGWMTPPWARVLARIFPGPRREKEIEAVYRILRDLHYNSMFLV